MRNIKKERYDHLNDFILTTSVSNIALESILIFLSERVEDDRWSLVSDLLGETNVKVDGSRGE
jgi:hypothetical protein